MPWALPENNLAEVYLLPIGFDEREACAAAGHEAALQTIKTMRIAAKWFKKDKVWTEVQQDIYIINASFITLHNTLRFKRSKKVPRIASDAQPEAGTDAGTESIKSKAIAPESLARRNRCRCRCWWSGRGRYQVPSWASASGRRSVQFRDGEAGLKVTGRIELEEVETAVFQGRDRQPAFPFAPPRAC